MSGCVVLSYQLGLNHNAYLRWEEELLCNQQLGERSESMQENNSAGSTVNKEGREEVLQAVHLQLMEGPMQEQMLVLWVHHDPLERGRFSGRI